MLIEKIVEARSILDDSTGIKQQSINEVFYHGKNVLITGPVASEINYAANVFYNYSKLQNNKYSFINLIDKSVAPEFSNINPVIICTCEDDTKKGIDVVKDMVPGVDIDNIILIKNRQIQELI